MSKDYRMMLCSGKYYTDVAEEKPKSDEQEDVYSEPRRTRGRRRICIYKMVIKRKDKDCPDKQEAEGGAMVTPDSDVGQKANGGCRGAPEATQHEINQ